MLFEGTLMRTALRGVLAVDEGVVFLAILIGMRERNVDSLTLQMHDGIETLLRHIVVEQILKTIARDDAAAVVEDGETRVQIGVVAQHIADKLIVELEMEEQRRVGFKIDICTVLLLCVALVFANEFATFERGFMESAIAMTTRYKLLAECVDGFQTHTIQTHTGSEDSCIVLSTGVQLRHGSHQRAQGNAATVVANGGSLFVLHFHFYTLTKTFVEFVDGIVYRFFQQHIDTVFGMATIAQSADIHTRTRTDMVRIVQVADFTFIVFFALMIFNCRRQFCFLFFCHYMVGALSLCCI